MTTLHYPRSVQDGEIKGREYGIEADRSDWQISPCMFFTKIFGYCDKTKTGMIVTTDMEHLQLKISGMFM